MSSRYYYVYISTNKTNTVLYTGVTNNLLRRMYEHREKLVSAFTAKYKINKLVWFEVYEDINEAIKREKQIKGGSRNKKIELIKSMNLEFEDLYSSLV